jgi:hypothetical protein
MKNKTNKDDFIAIKFEDYNNLHKTLSEETKSKLNAAGMVFVNSGYFTKSSFFEWLGMVSLGLFVGAIIYMAIS